MQKEIKLGLVVGFALLLAILLVWYKSGEEEVGKPGATETGAIDDVLGISKPSPAPSPPVAKEKEPEPFPLPPQAAPVAPEPEKPAEVQPAPAAPTIEIPKTLPAKGEIGPPAPKPAAEKPTPPALPKEVAKAPVPPKPAEEPAVKEEPAKKEGPAPEKPAAAPVSAEQTYVVQPGDNLIRIARKFYQDDSKWTVILEANKGVIRTPDTLYVGLKLKIPPLPAKKEAEASAAPAATKPPEKEKAGAEEGPKKYTVQRGDTLTSIAEDHYGDGKLWKKILDANKTLKDPKDLREGQVILIPPK